MIVCYFLFYLALVIVLVVLCLFFVLQQPGGWMEIQGKAAQVFVCCREKKLLCPPGGRLD